MSGIIRAARIDLVAYRRFVPLMAVVIACLSVIMGWQGPETAAGSSAFISVFALLIFSMNLSAQDDANGWSAYRLALPLSRRDVVLGRYAAIGLLVGVSMVVYVAGACVGLLLGGSLFDGALAQSEGVATTWGFMLFGMGAALALGSVFVGIIVPLVFRFGSERVMKFYPLIMIVMVLGPTLGLQAFGGDLIAMLESLFAALTSPGVLAVGTVALFGAALLIAALSATVSLRLYRTRDL